MNFISLSSSIFVHVVLLFRANSFLLNTAAIENRRIKINADKPFHKSKLKLSVNPNDNETPEERLERIKLVTQISKSFYQNNEQGVKLDSIKNKTNAIIENIPLWRVQWTELPSYQNVLNCHVAHYTHMFRTILYSSEDDDTVTSSLSTSKYFGHLYLPGGSENLNNPDYHLCTPNKKSKAAHVGTLMKVVDFEQLEYDGRLVLIVQALARFEVVGVVQHEPYAIANVKITPDDEFIQEYLLLQQDSDKDDEEQKLAASIASVQHLLDWESFEFKKIFVKDTDEGISPLSNFDLYHYNYNSSSLASSSSVEFKQVFQKERDVWLAIDLMIRLLQKCSNSYDDSIPIPTQILGLLPTKDVTWPDSFILDKYALQLQQKSSFIGTKTKTPFVLVDNEVSSYPPLRRAQRLSYTVWILLDNMLLGPSILTKQQILELTSITKRLEAAKNGFDVINLALRAQLNESPNN